MKKRMFRKKVGVKRKRSFLPSSSPVTGLGSIKIFKRGSAFYMAMRNAKFQKVANRTAQKVFKSRKVLKKYWSVKFSARVYILD